MDLAGGAETVMSGRLALEEQRWLAEHAVGDTPLLPGASLVEMVANASSRAGESVEVAELTLERPVPLRPSAAVEVQVRVAGSTDGTDEREVAVWTRLADPVTDVGDAWTRVATGRVRPADEDQPAVSGAVWPPRGADEVPLDGIYDRIADLGLRYGPTFRGLRRAWRLGAELYGDVELPDDVRTDGFTLHPALLDASLHVIAATAQDGGVRLPFAWQGVRIHPSAATKARVTVTVLADDRYRVVLTDASGMALAMVEELTVRPAGVPTAGGDSGLLAVEWTLVADAESAAPAGDVGLVDLDAALQSDAEPPATIFLSCFAADRSSSQGARDLTVRALTGIQRFLAEQRFADSVLTILTRGLDDPATAAVWGLVRSLQAEQPGRLRLIDIDDHPPALGAIGSEPQLAFRAGAAHAPRLAPLSTRRLAIPATGPWRLGVGRRGSLDGLAIQTPDPAAAAVFPEGDPAPGHVRVGVRAAGLNFRDVLIALGVYPDPSALVGSEAAGVVTAVGAGVTGFAPGDRVMGLFAGAAGPVADTDQRLLTRIPAGWGFAEAAGTPLVFLTAYYALADLAAARAGESVLIHSAAGGVGLAARQLAEHWGLTIYGTASPGKWEALRRAGYAEGYFFSSRTLEFEQQLIAATGGRGVDIVLNSLTQEFIDASLRVLAPGGRFLELGKADLRDGDRLPAETSVAYRAFDLFDAGPDRIAEMLAALAELFASGAARPLPVRSWDVRDAPDAFRYMQQARHIGKLVITVPRPLDPDGTVLITGGTGKVGPLIARHLAERHGARRLLLAGRRGDRFPGAAELRSALAEAGAQVEFAACDVADRAALARLLAGVPANRPLTAVVHAAGVRADATAETATPADVSATFAPKADAAWHLHELTGETDLAAFVLVSSAVGTVGNAGQGAYAAANAYLDGLAELRVRCGRPATSIAFGLWAGDGGIGADLDAAARDRIARAGFVPLSERRALHLLDAAIGSGVSRLCGIEVDAAALAARAASGPLPPVLSGLAAPRRGTPPGPASAADGKRLRSRLGALSADDRRAVLLDLVRENAAAVLGYGVPAAVPPEQAFHNLGFDSLTSVELRNRLGEATGVRLASTVVFDHPTANALARHLDEEMAPPGAGDVRASQSSPGPASASGAGNGQALVAEIDMLRSRLLTASLDDVHRARVAARLRDLMAAWLACDTMDGGLVPDGVGGPDDLSTASFDELFDFIDNDLGRGAR
jgi:NADPH:quinone reductase-like Zn-dependent oxidoreductase/acyl carrier protein